MMRVARIRHGERIVADTQPESNMAETTTKKQRKPPGPEPEVLKIEGNWKEAMRKPDFQEVSGGRLAEARKDENKAAAFIPMRSA